MKMQVLVSNVTTDERKKKVKDEVRFRAKFNSDFGRPL
jgi:hypothetical protein